MARPRKPIDAAQVEKLAGMQCTNEEIAAFFDVNPSTLKRRFAPSIKKGRENGKASLKRIQFESAMNGSVAMMIWLGKQYLGQSEKIQEKISANVSNDKYDAMNKKELEDEIANLEAVAEEG